MPVRDVPNQVNRDGKMCGQTVRSTHPQLGCWSTECRERPCSLLTDRWSSVTYCLKTRLPCLPSRLRGSQSEVFGMLPQQQEKQLILVICQNTVREWSCAGGGDIPSAGEKTIRQDQSLVTSASSRHRLVLDRAFLPLPGVADRREFSSHYSL